MTKPVKVFSIAVITVAWLFWELWANFDHDPDTWPLTWVIVRYVPAWITLPAVLILALWLPWHFWTNYRERRKPEPPAGPVRESAANLKLPQEVAVYQAQVHLDALNRAARTFVQGLLVDVTAAVTLVASTQLGDLHWTKAYWTALYLLLTKTAVSTAVAYVYRRVRPPAAAATSPQSGSLR